MHNNENKMMLTHSALEGFKRLPKPLNKYSVNIQCRSQSIFGDIFYSCYYKLILVTPQPLSSSPSMAGAEWTKNFDFDNPRSLEKTLSGKELHRKLLLIIKKY